MARHFSKHLTNTRSSTSTLAAHQCSLTSVGTSLCVGSKIGTGDTTPSSFTNLCQTRSSLPEIPSVQQSVERHMFIVSDGIINVSFLKVGARPDSFMRPLPALPSPPHLFTSPCSSKLPLEYRLLNTFLNQKHLTFIGQ